MNRTSFLKIVTFACALMFAILFSVLCTGCGAFDPIQAKQQIDTAQEQVENTAVKLEEEKKVAEELGDEKKVADMQKSLDELAKLRAQLNKAEQMLDAATNPDGTFNVGGASSAIGAALPPPWNLLVMVGGPLLVGLVQEMRVRRETAAAVSLVNGITTLQMAEPTVMNQLLERNEDALKGEYTTRAKKIVSKHKVKPRKTVR